MGIERLGDDFIIGCDFCSEQSEHDTDDFLEAVEFFKEEGWKPIKTKNGWDNKCPACVESEDELGDKIDANRQCTEIS